MLNLPVRYDEDNQTLDDAKGQVLALLSWPGMHPVSILEINEIGRALAAKLNDAATAVSVLESVQPKLRGNPNWRKK